MGEGSSYHRFSLASIPEDIIITDYETGFEVFDDCLDEYGR